MWFLLKNFKTPEECTVVTIDWLELGETITIRLIHCCRLQSSPIAYGIFLVYLKNIWVIEFLQYVLVRKSNGLLPYEIL